MRASFRIPIVTTKRMPVWDSNWSANKSCVNCDAVIGSFASRSHCRRCGRKLCASCSQRTAAAAACALPEFGLLSHAHKICSACVRSKQEFEQQTWVAHVIQANAQGHDCYDEIIFIRQLFPTVTVPLDTLLQNPKRIPVSCCATITSEIDSMMAVFGCRTSSWRSIALQALQHAAVLVNSGNSQPDAQLVLLLKRVVVALRIAALFSEDSATGASWLGGTNETHLQLLSEGEYALVLLTLLVKYRDWFRVGEALIDCNEFGLALFSFRIHSDSLDMQYFLDRAARCCDRFRGQVRI